MYYKEILNKYCKILQQFVRNLSTFGAYNPRKSIFVPLVSQNSVSVCDAFAHKDHTPHFFGLQQIILLTDLWPNAQEWNRVVIPEKSCFWSFG